MTAAAVHWGPRLRLGVLVAVAGALTVLLKLQPAAEHADDDLPVAPDRARIAVVPSAPASPDAVRPTRLSARAAFDPFTSSNPQSVPVQRPAAAVKALAARPAQAPASSAAPAPPAPAPTAPPLPFQAIGMMAGGTPGETTAFVKHQDQLLVLHVGDTVAAGAYRVEAISARAVEFLYVPLNARQALNFPS